MLHPLPAPILLDIAIPATVLAWCLGFFTAHRKLHVFASLAIGCFVVLIGYTASSLHAPGWLVMAAPTSCDLVLLWYVVRTPKKMAIAYVSTWVIYLALHVLLSAGLHYDDLIPVWRLHG